MRRRPRTRRISRGKGLLFDPLCVWASAFSPSSAFLIVRTSVLRKSESFRASCSFLVASQGCHVLETLSTSRNSRWSSPSRQYSPLRKFSVLGPPHSCEESPAAVRRPPAPDPLKKCIFVFLTLVLRWGGAVLRARRLPRAQSCCNTRYRPRGLASKTISLVAPPLLHVPNHQVQI